MSSSSNLPTLATDSSSSGTVSGRGRGSSPSSADMRELETRLKLMAALSYSLPKSDAGVVIDRNSYVFDDPNPQARYSAGAQGSQKIDLRIDLNGRHADWSTGRLRFRLRITKTGVTAVPVSDKDTQDNFPGIKHLFRMFNRVRISAHGGGVYEDTDEADVVQEVRLLAQGQRPPPERRIVGAAAYPIDDGSGGEVVRQVPVYERVYEGVDLLNDLEFQREAQTVTANMSLNPDEGEGVIVQMRLPANCFHNQPIWPDVKSLRIELYLNSPERCLQPITKCPTSHQALVPEDPAPAAVLTGATYDISNVSLELDCVDLSAAMKSSLRAGQNAGGLPLFWEQSHHTEEAIQSNQSINHQLHRNVANVVSVAHVARSAAGVSDVSVDSYKFRTAGVESVQWRLGTAYFPPDQLIGRDRMYQSLRKAKPLDHNMDGRIERRRFEGSKYWRHTIDTSAALPTGREGFTAGAKLWFQLADQFVLWRNFQTTPGITLTGLSTLQGQQLWCRYKRYPGGNDNLDESKFTMDGSTANKIVSVALTEAGRRSLEFQTYDSLMSQVTGTATAVVPYSTMLGLTGNAATKVAAEKQDYRLESIVFHTRLVLLQADGNVTSRE